MLVLGIETSCDDTAAAIVDDKKNILSNVVLSQDHTLFGGIVPEIASRNHLKFIRNVIEKALHDARVELKNINAVAVTGGPGLIGGLMVGVMVAKGISLARKIPFFAINHLEGHALTIRLTSNIEFPYLLLLVSGGHCQLLLVNGVSNYKLLGTTLDDAVGEAFDKISRMLGMGNPGGPFVEKLAKNGDCKKYNFPRPLLKQPGLDFSFAGLKTAVKKAVDLAINDSDKADICASFQACVADVLINKVKKALEKYPVNSFVIAGGVAANEFIRQKLTENIGTFIAPPIKLCTDNAAMIAWAAQEKIKHNFSPDSLDFLPKARWNLERA